VNLENPIRGQFQESKELRTTKKVDQKYKPLFSLNLDFLFSKTKEKSGQRT
jgi:hypothetical protein